MRFHFSVTNDLSVFRFFRSARGSSYGVSRMNARAPANRLLPAVVFHGAFWFGQLHIPGSVSVRPGHHLPISRIALSPSGKVNLILPTLA
jgi:hypothetical protein